MTQIDPKFNTQINGSTHQPVILLTALNVPVMSLFLIYCAEFATLPLFGLNACRDFHFIYLLLRPKSPIQHCIPTYLYM